MGILALLALILILLGANIFFSTGNDRDTQWSTLVGIQRSRLLQVKASLESMQAARQSSRVISNEMLENYVSGLTEIDATLTALRNGGEVNLRDQNERLKDIRAVPYGDAKEKLNAFNAAWLSSKPALVDVGSKAKDSTSTDLARALEQLEKNSSALNGSLSELASILRDKARGKNTVLRSLQVVGMLVFTAYCLGCIVSFVKKLRSSDEEIARQTEGLQELSGKLQSSKGETDMILGSVSEGLFLLDEELNIGSQYSMACKRLFGMDELAGQSFIKLFRKLVPAKTFDTAKKYMNLIFKPHIEEATLAKFNPFHELEINFEDGRGGFSTKYLDFRFNRIFENKKVKLVMVTLSDVTDRVKLEQQLKESEEQTQRQLEMMLDILHCDVSQLDDFLVGAESHLNQISSQLKGNQAEVISSPARATEYKRMLDAIFRHMHTIKGDSSMIQLRFFEAKAHSFEEKIQGLRNRTSLNGNDFLPITLALSEMYENIREIRALVEKLGDLRGSLGHAPVPASQKLAEATEAELAADAAPLEAANGTATGLYDDPNGSTIANGHTPVSEDSPQTAATITASINNMVNMIDQLVMNLSKKQGKELTLQAAEFDEGAVPEQIRRPLRDIMVQLVRNSVTTASSSRKSAPLP
jgi:HPt (histidine-containing phosphotransfer) domain-containing protein